MRKDHAVNRTTTKALYDCACDLTVALESICAGIPNAADDARTLAAYCVERGEDRRVDAAGLEQLQVMADTLRRAAALRENADEYWPCPATMTWLQDTTREYGGMLRLLHAMVRHA